MQKSFAHEQGGMVLQVYQDEPCCPNSNVTLPLALE
jgi:hypothetical protein